MMHLSSKESICILNIEAFSAEFGKFKADGTMQRWCIVEYWIRNGFHQVNAPSTDCRFSLKHTQLPAGTSQQGQEEWTLQSEFPWSADRWKILSMVCRRSEHFVFGVCLIWSLVSRLQSFLHNLRPKIIPIYSRYCRCHNLSPSVLLLSLLLHVAIPKQFFNVFHVAVDQDLSQRILDQQGEARYSSDLSKTWRV